VIINSSVRLIDFVISILMLVMLSPLLVTIGIAIRLTSRGPVLFTQLRYGMNKKKFTIFKFRTMTSTESNSEFKQATVNDARVTRIGKFLRSSSIDELPQLANVVLGHMSLVGPRPHPISLDDHFSKSIPDYDLRYTVRPGLTGLAQIRGLRGPTPKTKDMAQRITADVEFVEGYSLRGYWKILIITPLIIFLKRGRGT